MTWVFNHVNVPEDLSFNGGRNGIIDFKSWRFCMIIEQYALLLGSLGNLEERVKFQHKFERLEQRRRIQVTKTLRYGLRGSNPLAGLSRTFDLFYSKLLCQRMVCSGSDLVQSIEQGMKIRRIRRTLHL